MTNPTTTLTLLCATLANLSEDVTLWVALGESAKADLALADLVSTAKTLRMNADAALADGHITSDDWFSIAAQVMNLTRPSRYTAA